MLSGLVLGLIFPPLDVVVTVGDKLIIASYVISTPCVLNFVEIPVYAEYGKLVFV